MIKAIESINRKRRKYRPSLIDTVNVHCLQSFFLFPCSFNGVFLTRFLPNLSYPAFLSPSLRSERTPPRKFTPGIHRESILTSDWTRLPLLFSCIKRDANSIIFAILLSFRSVLIIIISHFTRAWFVTGEPFPFPVSLREAVSTIKVTEKKKAACHERCRRSPI